MMETQKLVKILINFQIISQLKLPVNFVRSFRTKFFSENFDFYLRTNARPFATISGNFKTFSEGDKVDFLSVIACELAWRSARLVILLQWKRQPTARASTMGCLCVSSNSLLPVNRPLALDSRGTDWVRL